MTHNTIKEASDLLEGMVDQYGLANVLRMLGQIAGEKAEHIATNWQDASLAKKWDRAARLLDTAAGLKTYHDISLGIPG